MPRVVIDPAVPDRTSLDNEIARLRGLDVGELRARWHTVFRRRAPPHLPRHLLFRILAYRLQADRPANFARQFLGREFSISVLRRQRLGSNSHETGSIWRADSRQQPEKCCLLPSSIDHGILTRVD